MSYERPIRNEDGANASNALATDTYEETAPMVRVANSGFAMERPNPSTWPPA